MPSATPQGALGTLAGVSSDTDDDVAEEKDDALKLAKRLEKHELLEFRRIAALLYRVGTFRLLRDCTDTL